MGSLTSSQSPASVENEMISLPPPQYLDSVWMVSCRPTSTTNKFSKYLLLFQPDVRQFCPEGRRCTLFARAEKHRESQPQGEQHQEDVFLRSALEHSRRCIHISTSAVKAHAKAERVTEVVNAPELRVNIPHVNRCWSLEHDGFPPQLESGQGQTAVVLVHGFRQRFFRLISCSAHLHYQLSRVRLDGSGNAVLISFCWPSNLKKFAYSLARRKAEEAGAKLATVIGALRRRGFRVVVIGHSMGCRVALHCLSRPDGGVVADELILLGAAVSDTALTESKSCEFPRSRVAAENVTAFYSCHDETLSSAFGWGEALSGAGLQCRAMGLCGLASPLPEKCASIDVSGSVPAHNLNRWLLSADVMRHVGTVVYHGQSASLPELDSQETDSFLSTYSYLDSGSEEEDEEDPARSQEE